MAVNIPTDVVRSFVAIVDAGSMLRAADRVFVSQSALSLQMKRLEELLQVALFRREGRRLVLSVQGERFLPHARELLAVNDRALAALGDGSLAGPARIGFVQDFAETLLSGVLSVFASSNPDASLDVRVAGSAELLDLLATDRLDIVLCIGEDTDKAVVATADMHWLGNPRLMSAAILPLAVLQKPCRFRDAAIAALEAAGRPYRIVLETPSLSALRAAVTGGIGITCRTDALMGLDPEIHDGLPALPRVAYVLCINDTRHPVLDRLHDVVLRSIVESASAD